jgi:hypothetical protein
MAAKRKPIDGGKDNWFEIFGAKGAPGPGERGYVDPRTRVPFDVREAIGRSIDYFHDGEYGPMLGELLAAEGWWEPEWRPQEAIDDEDRFFSLDDLPDLLGIPEAAPEDAAHILAKTYDVLGAMDYDDVAHVPGFLEEQIILDALAGTRDIRLVNVSKEEAFDFVKKTHSQFPAPRKVGLLYAIGAMVGRKLVAVALANTPSAGFRSRKCPQEGIVDLSRIASDGTTKNASSMLAARVMDLFGRSGRRGVKPCLFVTYSLLGEKGTTYLSLAGKGLRPVGMTKPQSKPSGARKGATMAAKPDEAKIIWEYGPEALAPRWSLLDRTSAEDAQIAGARKAFQQWLTASAKGYFLGARTPLKAGTVLTGRPPDHGAGDDLDVVASWLTERLFEEHRPPGAMSRLESVYLVNKADPDRIEKAGGYADQIYQVEPEGPVERNDVGWWPEMFSVALEAEGDISKHDRARAAKIAEAYFSGRPTPRPLFEYRATSARVVREVRGGLFCRFLVRFSPCW